MGLGIVFQASFQFDTDIWAVLSTFSAMPDPLRPAFFSHEETIGDSANRFSDRKRLETFVAKSQSGFFLLNDEFIYSIRLADDKPIVCDCAIHSSAVFAKQLVLEMSSAQPQFGFACLPEELNSRNRIVVQLGDSRIESWVGRDTRRFLPGLYWLTLISAELTARHHLKLSEIEAVAHSSVLTNGGGHLFQFYERPEAWKESTAVSTQFASQPGIFNIDRLSPRVATAKSFLEVHSLLRDWR
jgi:hypothetical protein